MEGGLSFVLILPKEAGHRSAPVRHVTCACSSGEARIRAFYFLGSSGFAVHKKLSLYLYNIAKSFLRLDMF